MTGGMLTQSSKPSSMRCTTDGMGEDVLLLAVVEVEGRVRSEDDSGGDTGAIDVVRGGDLSRVAEKSVDVDEVGVAVVTLPVVAMFNALLYGDRGRAMAPL